MKQYFSDIINIFASENPDCLDSAATLLTEETIKYYPHFLYKYRSFDENGYGIDTLEKDYLYANSPAKFDDPFDASVNLKLKTELKDIEKWIYAHIGEIIFYCIPPQGMRKYKHGLTVKKFIDVQNQFLDEHGKPHAKAMYSALITEINKFPNMKKQKLLKEFEYFSSPDFEKKVEADIRQAISNVVNSLRNKILLVSLTERKDNQNMWERYSDKYTGFVIEYQRPDFTALTYEQKKLLVSLLPVRYYKRIPGVELLPFMQYEFYKKLYGKEMDITAAQVKLFCQILYKHSDYCTEEEWRLISNSKENEIEFPFVSAVYAGYKITDENLERLKEICQKKELPLYKQEIRVTGKMGFQTVLEGKHNA